MNDPWFTTSYQSMSFKVPVCADDYHVADHAKLGWTSREPYICQCGEVYIYGNVWDLSIRYVPANPPLDSWWPK